MYGGACELILRIPDGFVDEFARHGSTRTREIQIQPQPWKLRNAVPPALADAHTADDVSKGKVLEHNFGEFGGEDSEGIHGICRGQLARPLVVQ